MKNYFDINWPSVPFKIAEKFKVHRKKVHVSIEREVYSSPGSNSVLTKVFVVLSIYNFDSRVKDKDQAKFEAEDITEEVLEYDSKNLPNVANIEMTPNDAKNNGKDWKFVVNYDVKRPADGNDVQIGAGKFIHYFSADNLPTMPKHIIFVLDIRLFHVIARK